MNIRKTILIFLSLCLLVSCNKSKEKFPVEIKKADSLFNSKNYEEAKELYNKVFESQPENKYLEKRISKIDSILKFDKNNAHYNEVLKIADSLFENKLYEDAIYAYESAAILKPDDLYPVEKMEEIDTILKGSEEKIDEPYHIIVGCFAVESNAIRLRNKLQDEGYNAHFITRKNGTMKAVTYTSHPDIHDAYNNLNKAKKEVHKDAWVLYYIFE